MRVALGFKAHSGWAALVVIGENHGEYVVVDRRRIELVDDEWQKQPYHAAQDLTREKARDVVKRGVTAAQRGAIRELRVALKRERTRKHEIAASAVLVSDPMPDWSTEQILAVHFRMHKAEGVLFKDALARATKSCKIDLVAIPEKQIVQRAEQDLNMPFAAVSKIIADLGKAVGSPWGKDQKEAALAALIALQN